jgi:Spherulation-specific family 4
MRVRRLASVAAAVILALPVLCLLPVTAASGQPGGPLSSEHIITTLYAYPGISIWNLVTGNAPAISASIVDMCAADGSGSGCDGTPWKERPPPAWTVQIQALQNAGITPLVYIATGYGDAGGSPSYSLATAESEVSEAVAWYGRGIGFMFDEAATSCALESGYYGPLYRYAKRVTNDGTVELSPGTVTAGMSCYMNAADILQVFEGPETGGNTPLDPPGFRGHAFPQWLRDYPASRFAATISAASASGVGTDVAAAAADRIGNVYVDDEPEPDPGYQTLPSFWPAEVANVAGLPPAGVAVQRITAPLYATANSPAWAELAAGVPAVRAAVVDICAPDGTGSGCDGRPADAPDPAWPPAIGALRRAGVLPLYYIATDYGGTPLPVAETEVLDAVAWYGTPSVMFDQVPTSCSALPYYQALYGFVHALGGIVMLDPGTVTPSSSCYMPASDILGVFAGSQSQFQGRTFPSWLAGYPASRFSAVVSAGTAPGVAADVADAARDGIGNVYVDDEAEPPGYATLPAFWPAEIAAARQGTAPPPLPGRSSGHGCGQPAARRCRWAR